jgi:hypothetical protein
MNLLNSSVRICPNGLFVALAALLAVASCRREGVTHVRVGKSGEASPSMSQPPSIGEPPTGGPIASGQDPAAKAEVPLPPKPVRGEKLTWTLPKGWAETKGSGMRYATLQPSVKGKSEVSVIMLSGAFGGELANVNRWRGQIGLEPVDEAALPKLRTTVVSPAGPVAVYDFAGEGAAGPRMVVGMLVTAESSWFLKLNGDLDAVSTARADFVNCLRTLQFE